MSNDAQKLPPPTAAAANMGLADKTVDGDGTSIKYLNIYLSKFDQWPGVNSIDDITDEHVEGECLKNFFLNFVYWVGTTAMEKDRGTGYLENSAKLTYYKSVKRVLINKFPDNIFSTNASNDWHASKRIYFEKLCKRSKIQNEEEKVERKSEPLYRDLSSSLTVERAKYLEMDRVDANMIAQSLVKNVKDYDSASRLAEFSLNRVSVARGGEHNTPRYDEGAWDSYFQAPDFDWNIIKQTERQCMLVFCDLTLYRLCPFFSLAVFYLFDGLRRDKCTALKAPYIFPHLRSMKNESVASRMTRTLRGNIEFPHRREAFTSRSMRKGSMTEIRLHRDLSYEEELARSGHTIGGGGPPKNSNAEGYIASTPGMNAPGGLAMAGYENCHMQPQPMSFACLGTEVRDAVQRLVNALFVNDVPELKKGGKLRPLVNVCAARLIGSLNELVRDVGYTHPIVQKILVAAEKAVVDDDRVMVPTESVNLPRYYIVLKDWSKKIRKDFVDNNPQHAPVSASQEARVNGIESMFASIHTRLSSLEEAVRSNEDNQEIIQLQRDENQRLNAEIDALKAKLYRQDKMLKAAMPSPERIMSCAQASAQAKSLVPMMPALSSPPANTSSFGEDSASTAAARESNVSAAEEPPSKKQKTATSATPPASATANAGTTSESAYNTVVSNAIKSVQSNKTAGVTVLTELERFVKEGTISTKQKEFLSASGTGLVPKSILNNMKHDLFVGLPYSYLAEGPRYCRGMTAAAMAITAEQWKELCNLEATDISNDKNRRTFLVGIEAATLLKVAELEVKAGIRKNLKSKATSSIHSLAERLQKLKAHWAKEGMSDLEINNKIQREIGIQSGQQSLRDAYARSSSSA
ncbi:hypothetical protein ACHAWT_003130 [Skeletonema menzelii]